MASNSYAHEECVQEYMFNGIAMHHEAAKRPLTTMTTRGLLAYWVILHAFSSSADIFLKKRKSKNSFSNTIRLSNIENWY